MSASVHGDEDGVGQVKMETMASWHLAGGRWAESRRKAKASCLAGGRTRVDIGGLVVSSSKPSAGDAYGVRYSRAVWWFGPQNHRWQVYGFGPQTRAEVPRRNGRHVAASRSSRRGKASGEEARWPSDEDDTGLDLYALGLNGLALMYLGAFRGM
jgi:hypothetical protein